jgi:hypothetical protein
MFGMISRLQPAESQLPLVLNETEKQLQAQAISISLTKFYREKYQYLQHQRDGL